MLGIIWITLAVVFFYFSIIYWRYSTKPIRPFIFRKVGGTQQDAGSEPEPEQLPVEFERDLEGFIDTVNNTNKIRYRVAAAGFLIAGVNALANLFLF